MKDKREYLIFNEYCVGVAFSHKTGNVDIRRRNTFDKKFPKLENINTGRTPIKAENWQSSEHLNNENNLWEILLLDDLEEVSNPPYPSP